MANEKGRELSSTPPQDNFQGVYPPAADKDTGPWCSRCNKEYTKVHNIDGQDITLCPRCDGGPEDYKKETTFIPSKSSNESTITKVAASTQPNPDADAEVEIHDEADTEQREEEF